MDYKNLGLKIGLEIHQQLDTPKLFSGAPSYLRSDEPDYIIKRKLHAVAGESGNIDAAVKHEASQDKDFEYESYKDSISLVELDEEPPHAINANALEVALQIALLLNCEIYPATQVMRKLVIDGSNTSGFQRTVLIAHDGYIETIFGKVPVDTVALEEDSARVVNRDKNKATYRLDRLGIPLVEISTAPAMHAPEQAKEAALKLGEILRACKVKRGIGTIRQDLNISIEGHEKVEVKGFQDPAMMVKTVEKEIQRQIENKKNKKKTGEVRNALPSGETEFLRPLPGKSRMYPETDVPLLKLGKERLDMIKRNLPKLREEIRLELKKKGLTEELINLVLDGNLDEFTTLTKVHSKDANIVAKMITLWRYELATKSNKTFEHVKETLTEALYEKLLEALNEKKIEPSDIKNVITKIYEGSSLEEALKIEKLDENVLEEQIRKIIKEKPGLRPNAYMGLVMEKLKGKINAKKAMEIISQILSTE